MKIEEILQKYDIILYTDGSCINNGSSNAIGGWAYIIIYQNIKKEFYCSGFENNTTNNRMEMKAILNGLKKINSYPSNAYLKILVISDSQYCIKGASNRMYRWQEKGWQKNCNKGKGKRDIKNIDLWKEMFAVCSVLKPDFSWIKGHSGNKYNELCDLMASTSRDLQEAYSKSIRYSTL